MTHKLYYRISIRVLSSNDILTWNAYPAAFQPCVVTNHPLWEPSRPHWTDRSPKHTHWSASWNRDSTRHAFRREDWSSSPWPQKEGRCRIWWRFWGSGAARCFSLEVCQKGRFRCRSFPSLSIRPRGIRLWSFWWWPATNRKILDQRPWKNRIMLGNL